MRCTCNRFMKTLTPQLAANDGMRDIYAFMYDCKCGLQVERYGNEETHHGNDGNKYVAVNNKLELIKTKEEIKMSFLKTNPNEAGGFGPLTPGEYEVVISEAKVTQAKSSGADMLKLTLTVRSNVEQLHQKRKIFDNLVVSEKAMFKFHNLSMALFGEGTEFATLADFKNAVLNQYVRVLIKTEDNEYQGQTTKVDRVVTYMAPKDGPGGEAGGGDPFQDDGMPIDISEDDLPF